MGKRSRSQPGCSHFCRQARNWRLETGGRGQEAGDGRLEPEEVFLQIINTRFQRGMKIKYESNFDSYLEKLTIHLIGGRVDNYL